MNYIEEIMSAIERSQPVSPWALHSYCPSWYGKDGGAEGLRKALNIVIQVGWVRMTEDAMLVTTECNPSDPGFGAPSSSPGEADPDVSTALPTQGQEPRPTLQLVPTDHPTSESHPPGQTKSRMRVLHYAIQSGIGSLSRLEDELGKFLLASRHLSDGKLRRGVSDLLHRASVARREFEASHKWIQEILDADTQQ